MVRRKQLIPKASYPSEECCRHIRRRINNDTKEENNHIEEGEPDRLSDLPECLLSNILSRLLTKEAVQTSALSKKWEFKWAYVYNLDFSDKTSNLPFRKERFIKFVDRVLIHGGNSSIQNFKLKCSSDHDLSRVQDWISTALRRNVEKLQIKIWNESLVLPGSIYESKFLEELNLMSRVALAFPRETFFTNIRRITFKHVMIRNQDLSNGNLLLKFPFLECLHMYYCQWRNVASIKLEAPLLTTFFTSCARYQIRNRIDDFVFEFCGSKLVDFELNGAIIEDFVLPNPSLVQSATFKVLFPTDWIPRGNRAARVLRQMHALTYLELSGEVLIALNHTANIGNLPLFGKLIHLKLCTFSSFSDTSALVGLLQRTPVLQILTMDMSSIWGNELMYDESGNAGIPSCFTSHLKEVKFLYAFDSLKREENLELLIFILKNSKELQLMEIIGQKNRPIHIPSPQIQQNLMSFAPRFASVVFS